MTFSDFVRYIGTPAALGVVSSIVVAILRKVWPTIQEGVAVIASLLTAVLAYIIASYLVPLLPQLPPELELYWPAVVYLAQQIWYWLMKDQMALYRQWDRL